MNGLLEALCLLVFCGLLALVVACESEIRETFNESMGGVEDSSSGGLGAMVSRGINSASFTSSILMSTAAIDFGCRQCVCACVCVCGGGIVVGIKSMYYEGFLNADEGSL